MVKTRVGWFYFVSSFHSLVLSFVSREPDDVSRNASHSFAKSWDASKTAATVYFDITNPGIVKIHAHAYTIAGPLFDRNFHFDQTFYPRSSLCSRSSVDGRANIEYIWTWFFCIFLCAVYVSRVYWTTFWQNVTVCHTRLPCRIRTPAAREAVGVDAICENRARWRVGDWKSATLSRFPRHLLVSYRLLSASHQSSSACVIWYCRPFGLCLNFYIINGFKIRFSDRDSLISQSTCTLCTRCEVHKFI